MRRPSCAMGLVFISVIFLSVMKYLPDIPDHSEMDGRSLSVTGLVTRHETREYEDGNKIIYVYLRLDKPYKSLDKGDVLKCALSEGIHRPKTGACIRIKGRIQAFSRARNPGMFDQLLYQKSQGVACALKDCDVLEETEKYDRYREFLSEIREYLGLMLDRVFGPEDGSILRAITLGDKTALDSDTKSLYQRNGIIHILAVSGLHISILGAGLYRFLKMSNLPDKISVPIAVLFMYSYGQMCGSSASSVRAITMFSIRMGAVILGRTYDLLTALTAAALLILASSPLYITQSGFLFSFTAVLAAGTMTPVTDEVFMIRAMRGRKKSLMSSFSAGADIAMMTLPIHTGFYYSFPFISLMINLVVIPLMTVVFAGSLLAMSLGAVWLPLAYIPAFPVSLVLKLYHSLCSLGDALPVNNVITGCPPVYRVVLYYLIILVMLIHHRHFSPVTFLVTILTAMSVLVFRPFSGFNMTFVDIGQGDCIYMTDGSGLDILTDGGSSTENTPGERIIEPFLKYNGVRKLDYVFITHLDSDHYNGITELVELSRKGGVKVGQILLNNEVLEAGGEKYEALSKVCIENGVPLNSIKAGDRIVSGSLTVRCLYPEKSVHDKNTDMNALSTVLMVENKDFSCLLTGDIQDQGEQELIRIIRGNEEYQDIDVLKVAHHGSKNSTPEELLDLLKPRLSIISAGNNNSYGHPHAETMERLRRSGTKIYSTKESGAVKVEPKDRGIEVRCFLKARAAKAAP